MIAPKLIADDTNPYWLILTGRRAAAIRHWERLLAANRGDLRLWHELAVAHYCQARAEDARGAPNADAWEQAIEYWVGVLASHAYWRTWGEARAAACGVAEDDIQYLAEWFLTSFTHRGAREQDRVERVIEGVVSARRAVRESLDTSLALAYESAAGTSRDVYANLSIHLAHEWGAAVRLERLAIADEVGRAATTGGIPSAFERWLSEGRWISVDDVDRALLTAHVELTRRESARRTVPACGPTMLARLGLSDAARAWVALGGPPRTAIEALDALLEPVRLDVRQLEFYLDPVLGPLIAMTDAGQYERCESECKQRLVGGGAPRAKDLEKVLRRACHKHAEAGLAQGMCALAVSCLETAYQYCLTTIDTQPFASDLGHLSDQICDAIAEADMSLDAALELIDRLEQVAPGSSLARIRALRARLMRRRSA